MTIQEMQELANKCSNNKYNYAMISTKLWNYWAIHQIVLQQYINNRKDYQRSLV